MDIVIGAIKKGRINRWSTDDLKGNELNNDTYKYMLL